MRIQLKLHSKPISTNSAYYKRNNSFNEGTRHWRANFLKELQNDFNLKQITKLNKFFDPKKHMIKVCFTWFQPLATIMTAKGELSLRSMDVDNCLKIPTDCLFDKKYNNKWLSIRKGGEKVLYKDFKSLYNLDINDKFIYSTTSIKCPSQDNEFHCLVEVEVVDLFPQN